MGADPLTLALILGASGVQAIGEQRALEKQDKATLASLAGQRGFGARAAETIDRAIAREEPGVRVPRADETRDQRIAALNDALARGTESAGVVGPTFQGNVTDAFLDARADATRRKTIDAARLAQLLGRVRAPELLASEEAFDRLRTGSELETTGSLARGQLGADQLSIERAGRVNPLFNLAAAAMRGAGLGRAVAPSTTSASAGARRAIALNPEPLR